MSEPSVNWRDESSPWVRQFRRRVRVAKAAQVAATLALVLFVGMSIVGMAAIGGGVRWSTVVIVLIFLTSAGFGFRHLGRERRALQLVPERDGLVCPACRLGLDATGADAHCPRCGGSYAQSAVREYWEHYVLGQRSTHFQELSRTLLGAKGLMGRLVDLRRRFRASPGFRMGVVCVAMLVILAILGLFTSLSPFMVVVYGSWFVLLIVGFQFIEMGRKWRVGDSRHCTGCDYEKTPGHVETEQCPECGAAWRHPGGTVRGRPRRKPAIVAIGTTVALVGFFMATGQFGLTLGLYPTNLLIRQIAENPGFTMDEWRELGTRTLGRAQKLDLARRLLDKRTRKGTISKDANQWLLGEIAVGALPADVLERFYDEMSRLRIIAPAEARVGETVTLAIGMDDREPLWTSTAMCYYLGGVTVDGSPEARGRLANPRRRFDIAADYRHGSSRRSFAAAPLIDVPMTRPGELRLRMQLWRVYGPEAILSREIEWQPDGTPVIPNTAVWSQALELEHTITVQPGS